jgi:hypothetical protein
MVMEILETLTRLGVTVTVTGAHKIRLEPASLIPPELLPRIRETKAALLEALGRRKETCAVSCYQVEPGYWIHRPWDGCKTIQPATQAARRFERRCSHCLGIGACRCIACYQPGQSLCFICKGTGKTLDWVQ